MDRALMAPMGWALVVQGLMSPLGLMGQAQMVHALMDPHEP